MSRSSYSNVFATSVAILCLFSLSMEVSSLFLTRSRSFAYIGRPKYGSTGLSLPSSCLPPQLRRSVPLHMCAASDTISIPDRTHECLDFQFILDTLKNETVTVLGASIVAEREAPDHETASLNYAMVDEISQVTGFVPLRTSMNVWPVLRAIEMNSNPPEKEDLAAFADHIESIHEVHTFFDANKDKLPLFIDLVNQLILPDPLIEAFKGSFDDEANLNAEKFTELGRLRKQADALRARIVQTLQTILRDQDMREKIADK